MEFQWAKETRAFELQASVGKKTEVEVNKEIFLSALTQCDRSP